MGREHGEGHGVGGEHTHRALAQAKRQARHADAGTAHAKQDRREHRPEKLPGGNLQVLEQLAADAGQQQPGRPLQRLGPGIQG